MTETYTTKDFVEATGNAEFVGYIPGATGCSKTYTSGTTEGLSSTGGQASKVAEAPMTKDGER
jgi:hypothetical protein